MELLLQSRGLLIVPNPSMRGPSSAGSSLDTWLQHLEIKALKCWTTFLTAGLPRFDLCVSDYHFMKICFIRFKPCVNAGTCEVKSFLVYNERFKGRLVFCKKSMSALMLS